MNPLFLKSPSVYTICLRRSDGITIWLNLANVRRIIYDSKLKKLILYYLDNAVENYSGEDAIFLASQINQIHAKQKIMQEEL